MKGTGRRRRLPVDKFCLLPTYGTVARWTSHLGGNESDVEILGPEELDDAVFFVWGDAHRVLRAVVEHVLLELR